MKRPLPALIALLLLSEAGYIALARLEAVNGARSVATFLAILVSLFALYAAAWLVLSRSQGHAPLWVAFAGAVLFRLTLIPAGLPHDLPALRVADALRGDLRGEGGYERFLLYDHDTWRFLWDGHVLAQTGNPYRLAPDDPRLDPLADGGDWERIRSYVNHPSHRTVYPPLAQFFFLTSHALAPGSVAMMKLLWIATDLMAIVFIGLALRAAEKPLSLAVLYAWNPLVVKTFAGSGHADVLVVCALAACTWLMLTRRRYAAGAAFAAAAAAKLAPLILLPLVARRLGWKASTFAVLVAGCLFAPFASAAPDMIASLRSFGGQWEFNGGPYQLVNALTGSAPAARVLCGLLVVAFVAGVAWRDDGGPRSFARAGSLTLGFSLVLSPVVMPWYATWALPLAVVAGDLVWVAFSLFVCAGFFVMVGGELPPLVLLIEYALLAAVMCWKWMPGFRRGSDERRSDNDQAFVVSFHDAVRGQHGARARQRLDGRPEGELRGYEGAQGLDSRDRR